MDFIFPDIGNVIIPTDFHIFQRGGYTTNQFNISHLTSFLRIFLGQFCQISGGQLRIEDAKVVSTSNRGGGRWVAGAVFGKANDSRGL